METRRGNAIVRRFDQSEGANGEGFYWTDATDDTGRTTVWNGPFSTEDEAFADAGDL